MMRKLERPELAIGQIWRDEDPRRPPRHFEVIEINDGGSKVKCKIRGLNGYTPKSDVAILSAERFVRRFLLVSSAQSGSLAG